MNDVNSSTVGFVVMWLCEHTDIEVIQVAWFPGQLVLDGEEHTSRNKKVESTLLALHRK